MASKNLNYPAFSSLSINIAELKRTKSKIIIAKYIQNLKLCFKRITNIFLRLFIYSDLLEVYLLTSR